MKAKAGIVAIAVACVVGASGVGPAYAKNASEAYIDAQTQRVLEAVEALRLQVLATQVACEGADGGGKVSVQCPDVPAGYQVCKRKRSGVCRATRTFLVPVGTYEAGETDGGSGE